MDEHIRDITDYNVLIQILAGKLTIKKEFVYPIGHVIVVKSLVNQPLIYIFVYNNVNKIGTLKTLFKYSENFQF